ncbi:MAG: hypothetical protein ACOX45_07000 [Acutalibacteraceae bacterium]
MFKEYLLSAKSGKLPISLYTDNEDTEKFSLGFVQEFSNDYVLIDSITPFGFYDGYTIKSYKDIYRLEHKDKYGEKVYKLYLLHEQKHQIVDLKTDNLIFDLIHFAYENSLVVAIELHDSKIDDLIGFVSDIQDSMVTIEQLDSDGRNDGESVVSLEDITCVTCDSEREMAIKLLAGI